MHPGLLFTGFFFFAVAYNLLGPLATNIMASTGMSLAESGSLLSFQQIGALASMALSLLMMKRLRQSTVTRIGYAFLAIALLGVAISSGNGLLILFYTVLGFGSFLIDSGSNASLTNDFYEKRAFYIPLLHFAYSAGAIATGYLILPFKGPSWRWGYGAVGIIMGCILILSLLSQRKRDAQHLSGVRTQRPEIQAGPILPVLRDKAFIMYTLVIMFYMGSQVVCAAWIPVYVETELAQPAAITAASLTVFWIGTAVSRLIIGPVMHHGGKPFTLSIAGMLLAGLTLVGATMTDNIVLVLIMIALCGFFAGSTIPMYIVITSTWFPRNTAFISLSYIVSGTVGRMIFPWGVAKIAASTSLGTALLISSLMLFASALLIFMVKQSTKERPSY